MENKIHIARAFWGNSAHIRREISPVPIFENEVVYVWGVENQLFLQDRGYSTLLMHNEPTDPRYSTSITQYFHKLEVFREAEERFGEFIFLDWDCHLVRPLDDHFYDLLQNGNETQMPLYAYSDEMYLGILSMLSHSALERYGDQVTDELLEYVSSQETQMRKYHWKKDGLLVSPNACFFYNRRLGVGKALLEIATENKMTNCVEEYAFQAFVKCTIEEYMQKYEPLVLQGTADETRTLHPGWDLKRDPVIRLNSYIGNRMKKYIYFKHV
jgi:hypothetical protein